VVLGTSNDGEWQRLARQLLGRDDLAEDPRYARNDDRVACRAELDSVLSDWTSRHTLQDVQAVADAAGIGNAVYRTPVEGPVARGGDAGRADRWPAAADAVRRGAAADGRGS
jgi:crotonobetainyl-CoA:carnitine CoA-transferase CaiB-like acyl-CoA transferase